jgi:hypothetical protein
MHLSASMDTYGGPSSRQGAIQDFMSWKVSLRSEKKVLRLGAAVCDVGWRDGSWGVDVGLSDTLCVVVPWECASAMAHRRGMRRVVSFMVGIWVWGCVFREWCLCV